MKRFLKIFAVPALLFGFCTTVSAQRYYGLVDKSVAVIGNEMISLSDLEQEVQMQRTQGGGSDRSMRCEILETLMENKLFLMQARIDSLTVNSDMVESQLSGRIDEVRTALGGDEGVEEYFHKSVDKLRDEWRQQFEDQTLAQQEQGEIAKSVPEMTPYDVKQYLDSTDVDDLPVVPIKYQLSQICVYPDREAANTAVKEKLTVFAFRAGIVRHKRIDLGDTCHRRDK